MATADELHVVSKLTDTSNNLTRKINNTYKWSFTISILLIFICLNVIKASEDVIIIEWLKINVSLKAFVIFLSCCTVFTHQYCISLVAERERVIELIKMIYDSFDIKIKDFGKYQLGFLFDNDIANLTISKNLFKRGMGRTFSDIFSIILLLAIFFLPFSSLVVAAIYVNKNMGFTLGLGLVYGILFIIDFIVIASLIDRFFISDKQPL